ncbi:MAG: hypothetical protein JKX94_05825 [Sneathiella sp.]|nr:hypothetical protein [Sneathiella sp.]
MLSNNMQNCASHFDVIRSNLKEGQSLMMTSIALKQLITIFEQAATDAKSLENVSIPTRHQTTEGATLSENIVQLIPGGNNNDLAR